MLNLMIPCIIVMNHSVSDSAYTSCEISSTPDVILDAWQQLIWVSLGLMLQNCTTNDAVANELPFHHLRAVRLLNLLQAASKSKTSKDRLPNGWISITKNKDWTFAHFWLYSKRQLVVEVIHDCFLENLQYFIDCSFVWHLSDTSKNWNTY